MLFEDYAGIYDHFNFKLPTEITLAISFPSSQSLLQNTLENCGKCGNSQHELTYQDISLTDQNNVNCFFNRKVTILNDEKRIYGNLLTQAEDESDKSLVEIEQNLNYK